MKNNKIEFKENMYKNLLRDVILFISSSFLLYFVLKYFFNVENTSVNVAYMIAWILTVLLNSKTKSLFFDDEKKNIEITEKTIFGSKKYYLLDYNNAEIEIYNYSLFWSIFFGKKRIRILDDGKEVIKWQNVSNQNEIDDLEKMAEKRFKTI